MSLTHHEHVKLNRRGLTRRGFLHYASAGAVAAGTLNLRDLVSLQADELKRRGKSMILLWMAGGPSQFETFAPKPNHANGGETKAIKTSVPGIEIANGWEKTAAVMDDIALIRSMTNREGSHPRATYQLHTGYIPSGSVKHPSLSANIAKQIADPELELPSVVTVGTNRLNGGSGAGFLGVNYEPFSVPQPGQLPANVRVPVSTKRFNRRRGLLGELETEFAARGGETVVENHKQIYGKTAKMVLSSDVEAFDLSKESQKTKDAYGDTNFGRGCLLARRLVEAGVTFTEVIMGGWDTHLDNFDRVGQLAGQVDPAVAALITDLKGRGLLDDTLVVWTGEFGRTPRVNPRTGRDHYPRVFNSWMAGCGVKGGQVIGSSTKDGSAVAERPVNVPDLFHSICHGLKVDPEAENISPLGRPLKIVEGGSVVKELFA